MMQEYVEDNNALREEIARAHAVLDKAGIGEPGLRFSERIKMLVARERRLREALEGLMEGQWQTATTIARTALADEEQPE